MITPEHAKRLNGGIHKALKEAAEEHGCGIHVEWVSPFTYAVTVDPGMPPWNIRETKYGIGGYTDDDLELPNSQG